MALARGEGTPIAKALRKLPQTTLEQQMGTFIRNHDELDLERLTARERNEVYQAFAPDENMRIYDRGIRRRLAPMLKNNRRQLEMVYSLLLTLPGTPVLRYGDEIGMGEDLSLEERNSVRTAMQWTNEQHGGFSKNKETEVPVLSNGNFGYKKINVHDQSRKPSSLLNWFERAIAARKECIEFGLGDYSVISTGNKLAVAWLCRWENGYALAVHNLSSKPVTVSLNIKTRDLEHLIEHFSDRHYKKSIDQNVKKLMLAPYGYRWFRKSSLFL
jgi:maltose alpha-D-glucosyltransferase / alpha-amylase